jgi:pimeloyl-ACP methyl ester carboxylesterase
MTTAVAEATVVADAAAAGDTGRYEAWWAFSEGKAAGFMFPALAVALIAGREATSARAAMPGLGGVEADYARYVDRFGEVADYLAKHQPRALLLWGRHDAFFDIAEVHSWLVDLPRMEAHVFDAGHFLLETHAPRAADLMRDFVDGGPA